MTVSARTTPEVDILAGILNALTGGNASARTTSVFDLFAGILNALGGNVTAKNTRQIKIIEGILLAEGGSGNSLTTTRLDMLSRIALALGATRPAALFAESYILADIENNISPIDMAANQLVLGGQSLQLNGVNLVLGS